MFVARTMLRLGWLVALLALASGCAGLRVPAIDPSGDRIFSGAGTDVTFPTYSDYIPRPAFPSAPATPMAPGPYAAAPPCGTPPGCIAPAAQLRDRSYVLVMPGRVVAPVGSEVIVVSGLCGEGGNYVMRQPLEWMLAPDSVGNIVQVGKNKHFFLTDYLHASATKKIDSDFAVSRTHTHRQAVTRGNANLADDVVIGKGQSWVSVSSPTEGASHVTVVAPQETNWDHRRQTATIYWVDAQWTFPPPAIVRVDQRSPAILNTTLMRSQNIGPIEGWIVRYEVLDGPPATFDNGQTAIEIPSDINGHAPARLTPQSSDSGITQVGVQVIRPAAKGGDYPRMIVGQGTTSVTWSAPGLVVRPTGPANVEADRPAVYRVEVANTGDVVAPNVLLSFKVPEGCTVLGSNPPAQPFGDRLHWRMGDVQPRQAPLVVDVTLAMKIAAPYEHCFDAVSMRGNDPDPSLQARGCVRTLVNRAAIGIRTNGPQTAAVGSEVKFLVELENLSSLPLTNIQLVDTFDAGLEHIRGNPSPITIPDIGTLQPGQKTGVALTFIVRQPGTHCHRLEVTAAGDVRATAEGCVTAMVGPPVPRLDVRMTGPDTLRTGEEGLYTIEVRNNGTLPLSNLRITNRYSASLFPREATGGVKLGRGELFWELPELVPGDAVKYEFKGLARRADPSALCEAIVSAEPNMLQQAQVNTRILGDDRGGPPATPPVQPAPDVPFTPAPQPTPPNTPAAPATPSGGLKLDIVDTEDPVIAGRVFTYQIGVENISDQPDKSITLSFELPVGLVFEKFLGAAEIRTEGRRYVVSPVAEIRGRERLRPFELRVRAEQPGSYQFRVEARSLNMPQGIVETEETRVLGQ